MSQSAKNHDGQQHAELLLQFYHADVNFHHSQDWRDIVHYLLGIRCSGCPEIAGEVYKHDQSHHFGFKYF